MKGKLMVAGLVTMAMLMVAAVPQAQAQASVVNIHTNLANITNTTAIITGGVDGTRVLPGEPCSLWVKYSAVGSNLTNVVWGFDVSIDNSTWTTGQPLKMTNACNGTNVLVARAQFTAAELGAARYIRLGSVSTVTNTVSTTWCRYAPWR